MVVPEIDFTEAEKLWRKLFSSQNRQNEKIFEGYLPTIAEISRWLQACEGNYELELLHFLLQKCSQTQG